jgi:GNAT superfamily N-acetyltransferase
VPEDVLVRPARADDLMSTYDVFLAATNELRSRHGAPPVANTPGRRFRALAFRRHVLLHDPRGFWVAEVSAQVVGFGIATRRQRLWYLATLHVLPSYQGRGVGRELLRQCLSTSAGRSVVRTTISESSQPVSNAMYARHGLYQWVPLVYLVGATAPASTCGDDGHDAALMSDDLNALAAVDALDRVVLGVQRRVDHEHWLQQPDVLGLIARKRRNVIGYAYLSRFGSIGPAAALSADALPALLGLSLRTAAHHGIEHVSVPVPGLCRSALAYLLARGFRYGESINLLLASRPFGHLDRYLTSGSDALF